MTVYLYGSVFVAGFAVMAAEMAAPRLLAPSFGTSHLVWTHVIGTILSALALGAWLGGRCADRWPTRRAYGLALAAAGAFLSLVPLVSPWVLAAATRSLVQQDIAGAWASLAACCLLLAPPILLLGMIPPWAVRIVGLGRSDLGRVAGRLSALGALGSILGTFAASWVLLPLLGTRVSLLGAAGLLLAAGTLGALRDRRRGALSLALGTAPLVFATPGARDPQIVFEKESLYQHIRVQVDAAGWTRLLLDSEVGAHSVLPRAGLRTRGVWDVLSALPSLVAEPGEPLRILILGLAAGTIAWQIEEGYGDDYSLRIDGVELDREVIRAGSEFFGLADLETLRIHVGDARSALLGLPGPYDLIIVDAYRNGYVPFHLSTREFFAACEERLAPKGVLALNVAVPERSIALLRGLDSTLGTVFPNAARRFEVSTGGALFHNVVYVASSQSLDGLIFKDSGANPLGIGLRLLLTRATVVHDTLSSDAWTDDRAPVELATDLAVFSLVGR